jgi:hypothetical protein
MLLMLKLNGGSERAERFAACPPPAFGRLLLYLRKALSPLSLGNIVSHLLFRSPIFLFAATGVVRPPQRSKGGARAAGGGHERRWARRDCCGLSKHDQSASI